jgi:hypothetical protein
VADALLHIDYDLAGIGLIPAAVQFFSHRAELDNEVAGQVLWLDFAALLSPKSDQSLLIIAHDDPCIGAANESATSVWDRGIYEHRVAPNRSCNAVCRSCMIYNRSGYAMNVKRG